jgi:hypothetical protein
MRFLSLEASGKHQQHKDSTPMAQPQYWVRCVASGFHAVTYGKAVRVVGSTQGDQPLDGVFRGPWPNFSSKGLRNLAKYEL